MQNEKISQIKESELEALAKCFRRVSASAKESFLARLDEETLLNGVSSYRVIGDKENKRVYGAIGLQGNWGEGLFKEKATYRKMSEILDSFPYEEESLFYIPFLFVDPSFQGKGRGERIMKTIFSTYYDSSFITLLFEDDPIAFFLRLGFFRLPLALDDLSLKGASLYVKRKSRFGLCSDPAF